MLQSDWHIGLLKALRVVMIATLGAAIALGLWRLNDDLTQAPNGLLVITSAFLVATLSIMIVVYNLQWGHFDKKEKSAKVLAAPRTVLVFWDELLYVLLAFTALALNALSAVGYVGWLAATSFSWVVALLFLLLVALEFHTSIRNISEKQEQADRLPPQRREGAIPQAGNPMRRSRQVLRGHAENAATWLTFFFVFIFVTGQWSLPGADISLRAAWGFLLLGLVVFLRASWKPSTRWVGLMEAGKWLLMLGAGIVFLLMGIVGIGVAPFVPGLSPGLFVFSVAIGALLLLQGVRIIRWVLRHRPAAKLFPS